MSIRTRAWSIQLTAALLAIELVVLLVPRGEPSANGWVRGWTAGEIARSVRVTQSFIMGADGLHAVSFAPVRIGSSGESMVHITLNRLGAKPGIVADLRVPVSRLVQDEWFRIEFPPIADSAGQEFVVAVAVPNAARGQGIAVRAVKGDYRFGTFEYNGQRRWGALQLVTDASSASFAGRVRSWAARWHPNLMMSMVAVTAWFGFHLFAVHAIMMLAVRGDQSGSAMMAGRGVVAGPPAALR